MKDVVVRVIGLIKIFGDKSRIREVFILIVENGAVMLPDVGGDGAWSLRCTPVHWGDQIECKNCGSASLFAFNEVEKVFGFTF